MSAWGPLHAKSYVCKYGIAGTHHTDLPPVYQQSLGTVKGREDDLPAVHHDAERVNPDTHEIILIHHVCCVVKDGLVQRARQNFHQFV